MAFIGRSSFIGAAMAPLRAGGAAGWAAPRALSTVRSVGQLRRGVGCAVGRVRTSPCACAPSALAAAISSDFAGGSAVRWASGTAGGRESLLDADWAQVSGSGASEFGLSSSSSSYTSYTNSNTISASHSASSSAETVSEERKQEVVMNLVDMLSAVTRGDPLDASFDMALPQVLTDCLEVGLVDQALALINMLEDHEYTPMLPQVYENYLNLYVASIAKHGASAPSSEGAIDAAWRLWTRLVEAELTLTPELLNTVLRLCAITGDTERADEILALAAKHGGALTDAVMTQYVRTFVRAPTDTNLMALLNVITPMIQKDPNSVPPAAFALIFRGCRQAKSRLVQRVLELHQMAAQAMTPGVTINAISALGAAGEWAAGEELFQQHVEEMVSKMSTFRTALHNLFFDSIRMRWFVMAQHAYALLQQDGVLGLAEMHHMESSLVSARLDLHRDFSAIGTFLAMDTSIAPIPTTVMSVIRACCKSQDYKSLTATLKIADKWKIQLDGPTVAFIMRLYNTRRLFSRTIEVFKHHQEKLKPSQQRFDLAIYAYSHMGDAKNVEALMKECGRAGFNVTNDQYISLIGAYARAKDLQGALGAFESLKAAGIEPTSFAHHAVLNAYAEVGDVHGALEWVEKKLRRAGVLGDELTYRTLLKAANNARDPDFLMKVVQMMHDDGFQPTRKLYEWITTSLTRAGRLDAAIKVHSEMQAFIAMAAEEAAASALRASNAQALAEAAEESEPVAAEEPEAVDPAPLTTRA